MVPVTVSFHRLALCRAGPAHHPAICASHDSSRMGSYLAASATLRTRDTCSGPQKTPPIRSTPHAPIPRRAGDCSAHSTRPASSVDTSSSGLRGRRRRAGSVPRLPALQLSPSRSAPGQRCRRVPALAAGSCIRDDLFTDRGRRLSAQIAVCRAAVRTCVGCPWPRVAGDFHAACARSRLALPAPGTRLRPHSSPTRRTHRCRQPRTRTWS